MANVTTSTIVKSWTEGGTNGKRRKVVVADLAGTFTAGGTTNKILASAFGLTVVEECLNGVLDDNSKIYPLFPANDGSFVMVLDPTVAADANRANPTDITVTSPRKLRAVVKGY